MSPGIGITIDITWQTVSTMKIEEAFPGSKGRAKRRGKELATLRKKLGIGKAQAGALFDLDELDYHRLEIGELSFVNEDRWDAAAIELRAISPPPRSP